jgi:CubicO group peptidase (beta-lactamase class C family)
VLRTEEDISRNNRRSGNVVAKDFDVLVVHIRSFIDIADSTAIQEDVSEQGVLVIYNIQRPTENCGRRVPYAGRADLAICRPEGSDNESMMKRRDLLRTFGTVGALAAVARGQDPSAAGGQSGSLVSRLPTTETLATRLAASIHEHKVPGASAAVFRDGRWEVAAAGVSNVTTGVDVTAETVMHIGSITKVLNATLVMQLVDEGLVDLAAPLKRYVPDFQVADRNATERITVEMLLNHTCGIDGEYFPYGGPDAERIEDAIPRIARQGQIHAPGAELSYCNSGAVLAGYLAQRILGKSWYTLIEERLFQPLELEHSVVQPADALLHRAAVGHFLNADGTPRRTSVAFLNPSFAPAGTTAMLSANDLAMFAFAHVNDGVGANGHRLLSAASARQMRRQTASWRGVGGGGFGLGWMIMDKGIVAHDGGGPGIVSWLFADPAAKIVAAVLTNAAHGGPADDIIQPLYEAARAKPPGAGYDELEKQATDTPVDPHPYIGEYESVTLVLRVIAHENGIALRVRGKVRFYESDRLEESTPLPLRPIRDGHFTTGQGFVTFLNPSADGRMQHLASRRRLHKRTA